MPSEDSPSISRKLIKTSDNGHGIKAYALGKDGYTRWGEYLEKCPGANFWQSPLYLKAVDHHKTLRPSLIVAMDGDKIVGGSANLLGVARSIAKIFKPMNINYGPVVGIVGGESQGEGSTNDEDYDKAVLDCLTEAISVHSTELGAFRVYIKTPVQWGSDIFEKNGFNAIKSSLPGSVLIDLTRGPEQLRSDLRQQLRKYIRESTEKHGVAVEVVDTAELMEEYYNLYLNSTERWNAPIRYPKETFMDLLDGWDNGTFSRFIVARHNGKVIAGLGVAVINGKATLWNLNSDKEHWKVYPNHLLVWNSIEWACKLGCKSYEIIGIPAEFDHPEQAADFKDSMYIFKTGFGGKKVYRYSFYEKVISKTKFLLFKKLSRANEIKYLKSFYKFMTNN